MAQTDLNLANAAGAVFRADANNHLEALATLSSGATAPSVTFPNMWWFDEATNIMKQRNLGNTAWILVAQKDASGWRPYWNGSLLSSVFLQTADVVGQQTLWIPAASFVPLTTTGADQATEELATNDVMISGLDFDPATAERAEFQFQAPKSWDEGTLIGQLVWKDGATAGSGDVLWGLRAWARSDGDDLDVNLGTQVTILDTFQSTGKLHVTAETAAITVGGTPVTEDTIFLRVARNAGDASDTYTQDARLIGVRLHYTTDAPTDD